MEKGVIFEVPVNLTVMLEDLSREEKGVVGSLIAINEDGGVITRCKFALCQGAIDHVGDEDEAIQQIMGSAIKQDILFRAQHHFDLSQKLEE